jgi:hypothetical protein
VACSRAQLAYRGASLSIANEIRLPPPTSRHRTADPGRFQRRPLAAPCRPSPGAETKGKLKLPQNLPSAFQEYPEPGRRIRSAGRSLQPEGSVRQRRLSAARDAKEGGAGMRALPVPNTRINHSGIRRSSASRAIGLFVRQRLEGAVGCAGVRAGWAEWASYLARGEGEENRLNRPLTDPSVHPKCLILFALFAVCQTDIPSSPFYE